MKFNRERITLTYGAGALSYLYAMNINSYLAQSTKTSKWVKDLNAKPIRKEQKITVNSFWKDCLRHRKHDPEMKKKKKRQMGPQNLKHLLFESVKGLEIEGRY